ncbi:MAG: SDR family NAD(P)-dependent oxidoreductase [Acidobacteria bacterium]|nr:MAG: SDR family NAD(P)-dependent oxidoreductase [Acidobacteriota bacterium]
MDEHNTSQATGLEIAIIGMSINLPGARDVERYWQNLLDGVESIRTFTREEALADGVDPALLDQPGYVLAGPVVDDVDLFDAAFFGISPREAELMDPQQRLFLECCWHALEDAGYDPATCGTTVGIYAGTKASTYLFFNLLAHPELFATHGELPIMAANDKDYIANRIAYKLGLGGPAISVQTACSTSLVALHLACQGLLAGECDMALAGGVAVRVPQAGYLYNPGEVTSPDGHVRAFDHRAQGTVFGSGLGVVVVKRLEDALADGDHVYAVIKGSAVTNDGDRKVGFTAPGRDGQERVVRNALLTAEVDPRSITYLEAHGTGTLIGDPIEVGALTRVYRQHTAERRYCALGSVKTNIGHLNAAAGVASLVKAVLALNHRRIPGTLHFEKPNPQLELDESPFFINTETIDYPRADGPLRAGVSSFGIGGTNAHVILEEPPPQPAGAPGRRHQLLLLSARSEKAAAELAPRLAAHLEAHPEQLLDDVAFTLAVGRRRFEHRRFAVVTDRDDARRVLAGEEPQRLLGGYQPTDERPVVFLFSGQGSQHAGMAAALYRNEPTFRRHLDHAAEVLEPLLGADLRQLLWPPADALEAAQAQLKETAFTQPALFAVEYALARLWQSWGIEPQAMIGHSIGEYVAACLAGVMSADDALRLVAHRGRLMQSLPPGAMLSVPLPEEEIAELIDAQLAIAALNAPGRAVVSGPKEAIDAFAERLAARGVKSRRLETSHAFHSPMMEPILPEFERLCADVAMRPPKLPFVSNVTGTWITEEQATDPSYWARHLRQAVRFADGLATLLRAGEPPVLLEVGPGNVLTSLARRHPDASPEHRVLASLPHPKEAVGEDDRHLLVTLGHLWLAGVPVDWRAFYDGQRRRRTSLPPYPFQRQRYWIERDGGGGFLAAGAAGAALQKKGDVAEWFYLPNWQPSITPLPAASDGEKRWLVLRHGEQPLADAIIAHLEAGGAAVTPVYAGSSFARRDGGGYTIAPDRRQDHEALLEALAEDGGLPGAVLHLWSEAPGASPRPLPQAADAELALAHGFWSLIYLAQALGKQGLDRPLKLGVVTTGMRPVLGEAELRPEQATVLGPCKVLAQEYPEVSTVAIDVRPPAGGAGLAELAGQLVAETLAQCDREVAYRDGQRYVRDYRAVAVPPDGGHQPRLRPSGVYLITGGLGGFGLTFARYLAESVQARLVLTSRSGLPPRRRWESILAAGDDPRAARQIDAVRALEEQGAEVMVRAVDVTDGAAMRDLLNEIGERFGRLDGIIHAAGVPGGGLVQLKTPEMAARVLAPKVLGTLALDAALRESSLQPGFLMLCSSTIAILGGVGQVDYCAANNFLDAYAAARAAAVPDAYTVSVNWSGWTEVGMAVETALPPSLRPAEKAPPAAAAGEGAAQAPASADESAGHPLLQRRLAGNGDEVIFAGELSTADCWILDEHRIAGRGALPGTTHLELARAAFAALTGSSTARLEEVFFLTPLMVDDGERAEMRIVLSPQGERYRFRVESRPAAGGAYREHARGTVGPAGAGDAGAVDLEAVRRRCTDQVVTIDPAQLADQEGRLVSWGPRWQSLRQIHLRQGEECLAELELPPDFAADCDRLGLHPALLDVATALTSGLAEDGEYLPLSYRAVTVKAPLPPHVFSHLRARPGQGGKETVSTDVSLLDETGRELLAIEGFTMKKVGGAAAGLRRNEGAPAAAETAPAGAPDPSPFARGGMSPAEGVEVLRRILAHGRQPQIVASPSDLHARIRQAAAVDRARLGDQVAAPGAAESSHPRPDLATPYVAPSSELEKQLADLWQRVLGLDEVGVHDNFFELGGDSVMGIQIIAGAREIGLELQPEQLFEHQTIAELAALAEPAASEPAADAEADDEPDLSPEELAQVLDKLESV